MNDLQRAISRVAVLTDGSLARAIRSGKISFLAWALQVESKRFLSDVRQAKGPAAPGPEK